MPFGSTHGNKRAASKQRTSRLEKDVLYQTKAVFALTGNLDYCHSRVDTLYGMLGKTSTDSDHVEYCGEPKPASTADVQDPFTDNQPDSNVIFPENVTTVEESKNQSQSGTDAFSEWFGKLWSWLQKLFDF